MTPVPHTNESCHTNEWVMSHKWMRHVTHKWVSHITGITHMNDSCHTYVIGSCHTQNTWNSSRSTSEAAHNISESYHTYEWVRWHIRVRLDMSHTCKPFMSHTKITRRSSRWTSEAAHNMYHSCYTCKWVVSHTWMTHAMNLRLHKKHVKQQRFDLWSSARYTIHDTHESYHTCEWVISHIWTSRVTHMRFNYVTQKNNLTQQPLDLRSGTQYIGIAFVVVLRPPCPAYIWIYIHLNRYTDTRIQITLQK